MIFNSSCQLVLSRRSGFPLRTPTWVPGRWPKGKEPGTWWAEALPAAVPLPLNDMGCRVPALKGLVTLLGVCGVVLLTWLLPDSSEQVVSWLPVC